MKKSSDSPTNFEKVYLCIEKHLNLNVRDVSVNYLNDLDFLRCIKSNLDLSLDIIDDISLLKEFYIEFSKRIPGLYKWREKKVFIKEKERNDLSLLLSELLHSKSITQEYKQTEDWIREGLPHFLAKILCNKCKITYSKSKHQQYFSVWEKIHQSYDLSVLSTIIYAKDIRITKSVLKTVLNYKADDILEIPYYKVLKLLELE